MVSASGAQPGDLLLVAAGEKLTVLAALDRVRQFLANQVGIHAGERCTSRMPQLCLYLFGPDMRPRHKCSMLCTTKFVSPVEPYNLSSFPR